MKEKKLSKVSVTASYIISIVLIVGLIIGNTYAKAYSQIISIYLGHSTSKIVESDEASDSEYYKSEFTSQEELRTSGEELCQEIEEEGIVLLKNENNTLPLASGLRISVLGHGSVDFVYGGGGSGSVDTETVPTLLEALTQSGFEVNKTLWDFYETGKGSSYKATVPDVYGEGAFAVNEVPQSVYTDSVIDSFADYNDAALVVITRSGGESSDLPTAELETGTHYLGLDQNERDMIELATENFDNVIVMLNMSNTMELGFLEEYDIDACIWVGAVGQTGIYAIGEVLNGTVNPSGSLVDTYAYDVLKAPAAANFGSFMIENSSEMFGNSFVVYAEGIYVGYRYYETRYEDVVLGNESEANYNYTDEVQYPFGYGLSYTTFEWSDYSVKENDDTFEVTVKVTNTGDVAGKDVVQIYMQSPYTEYDIENEIEKASVELVGFEKTSLLEAGASETVTVTVEKENMKTYDANGYGTYIVEAGDYYFTAGENAHNAVNNILAAKGMTTENNMDTEGNADFVEKVVVKRLDTTTYAVSLATGNEISNEFEDVDIRYYDESFKYLTRNDWTGTWPTTYANGSMTASDELLEDLKISHAQDENVELPVMGEVSEEYGKLSAAMLIGLDYNDEMWEVLLNQLTLDEMTEFVRMGGYATIAIPSINLPATVDKDGPAGISSTLVGGGTQCTAFPAEVVIASTWNLELAKSMGESVGEDSLDTGVTGWYAPGLNTHRCAFGGRNFEYFSEDGLLSGLMGANVVEGVQSKGAFVTMKHFALNEQEINRMGGAMFANEQSVREIYLKPFELTVRDGNATGAMASMNRIGARWSGGHYGLMTATLRDEWGFEGFVITDQASYSVFAYQDRIEGLLAGTNLWLNTDSTLWEFTEEELTPAVVSAIRESAHDIIYTIVNSNAMNGISVNSKVVKVMPLWQYWLIAFDVVVAGVALFLFAFTTRKVIVYRRKK